MLPDKQTKKSHGASFEVKAHLYLESKNYEILDKNVHYSCGEIDLIAHEPTPRGLILVFIEVRKRDSRGFLQPEETLTYPKQRRLKNAIQLYLLKYKGKAKEVRIDLIGFLDEEIRHRKGFL